MRFYAIRRKDGAFMPQGQRRRGFTGVEPVDLEERPPRLFRRARDARVALTWWLKGETTVTMARGSVTLDSWEGEWDEDWNTSKIPGRSAADFEVAPVELTVGGDE